MCEGVVVCVYVFYDLKNRIFTIDFLEKKTNEKKNNWSVKSPMGFCVF